MKEKLKCEKYGLIHHEGKPCFMHMEETTYIKQCEYTIAKLLRAKVNHPGSEEHKAALKEYVDMKRSDPLEWYKLMQDSSEAS